MADKITEGTQLDTLGVDAILDSAVAQDVHLGRPLGAVRRLRSDGPRPGWQPSSVTPGGRSVKIAMSDSTEIASGNGTPRAVCP